MPTDLGHNSVASVPDMLRQGADVYEQRNKVYGNNYKDFGLVMAGLFPAGMSFHTVNDYNRLGIFVQIVSKLGRYANMFSLGGHDDSLLDLAVYTTMLRELDAEIRVNSIKEL